jgi:hypothetical protein
MRKLWFERRHDCRDINPSSKDRLVGNVPSSDAHVQTEWSFLLKGKKERNEKKKDGKKEKGTIKNSELSPYK